MEISPKPHLENCSEFCQGAFFNRNIINNDYYQDSRALYIFFPNKPFGSLLEISPKNHISLKSFNSEFK